MRLELRNLRNPHTGIFRLSYKFLDWLNCEKEGERKWNGEHRRDRKEEAQMEKVVPRKNKAWNLSLSGRMKS